MQSQWITETLKRLQMWSKWVFWSQILGFFKEQVRFEPFTIHTKSRSESRIRIYEQTITNQLIQKND